MLKNALDLCLPLHLWVTKPSQSHQMVTLIVHENVYINQSWRILYSVSHPPGFSSSWTKLALSARQSAPVVAPFGASWVYIEMHQIILDTHTALYLKASFILFSLHRTPMMHHFPSFMDEETCQVDTNGFKQGPWPCLLQGQPYPLRGTRMCTMTLVLSDLVTNYLSESCDCRM